MRRLRSTESGFPLAIHHQNNRNISIMKIMHISVAALAGAALLLASCVVPADGYGTFTYSTNGYSSSVAWTNASYDANGFPIYGYSYGRPVYGYTSTGAAIFTIAALTALCFVPDWGPAPWYHGHWHYPPHIHRCSAPPRHAHGHHPGVRPHGGLHAPIHKNPHQVLGKPHGNHKPAVNHRPIGSHRPVANHRPNDNHRPVANHRPNIGSRPVVNNRPNDNHRPAVNNRPNVGSRPAVNNRPNIGSRPVVNNRPNIGSRPAPRPQMNRVSGSSRPAARAHRPTGGGNRGGRGHR